MKTSFSRKLLNVAANIEFFMGIMALNLCISVTSFGIKGILHSGPGQDSALRLTAFTMLGSGIAMGLNSIFAFVYAILSRMAVRNPARVMPVWYLSLLTAANKSAYIGYNVLSHTPANDLIADYALLIFALLILLLAGIIKKEVPVHKKTKTVCTEVCAAESHQ